MKLSSLPVKMALLAGVLLLAALALAAPPQTINYQGYLKNTAGTPVNAATNLTFSIYSSTSGAGAIWSETKSVTPANGIFSTRLGTGTPLTLGFGRQLYLGIRVESDPEMRPLQPLASVPSAYRAAMADSLSNNSIGTSSIMDNSITTAKIATGAVTDTQISGTISADKLDLSTVQKKYSKTAVVAQSGGDYSSPVTAMIGLASWCDEPSASNPCLLKIMPGVYDLGTSYLFMQQYVDIEGSGEGATIITSSVSNAGSPPLGVVNGASNAEIRSLTVRNIGASGVVAALVNSLASPRMTHITATASGGTVSYGVYNESSSPKMYKVTASASGGAITYGVYNFLSNSRMSNVTATASDGTNENYGAFIVSSIPTLSDVKATASGGVGNYGIMNIQSPSAMNGVTAIASGGNASFGVYNTESAPTMINVIASGDNGAEVNYGLYNSASSGTYVINIDRSTFIGSTNSILNDSHFTLRIGASKLIGPVNDLGTKVYLNSYSDTATLGTITTANLADGSVTGAKIADGTVTTIKIDNSVVTTAKIANAAVTANKLDTAYVKLAGDTMTGQLNLPASGVKIGNSHGAITESWWEFGKNDGVTGTGIDFHGGTTLTDYTARIHRLSGDNAAFQIANAGTGPMEFWTGASQNLNMVITGTGNVGIGTTGPGSRLTVGPTLNGTPLSSTFVSNAGVLGTTAGNVLNLANLGFTTNNQTSLGFKARRNSGGTDWQTSAIGLSFDVDNTSPVNNAQIWMTAAGNVGVGTTSPAAKLEVAGGDLKVSGTGSGIVFPDGTIQTTAATPSWHQILPAAQRFQLVMNDEAVLDRETGLVWARSATFGPYNWETSIAYCANLTIGGRKGWRMPKIEEIASLVDPTQSSTPALPVGHPFTGVQGYYYWSSSTNASDANLAGVVEMYHGLVYYSGSKNGYFYVWPVRSGQ